MKKPKIALVLSGGGALGFAHVGALEVLEENNINIDIITGTSMGAVVGATYCSGTTIKEMRHFASKISLLQLYDFNIVFLRGLLSGQGVARLIKSYLKKDKIEDFNKQFACVSVDIENEKEVVFKSGDAITAVRASMSIPGFFMPVKYGDGQLVDGGIMNNYPDGVAKEMGADIIIGIDVISDFKMENSHKTAFGILLTCNFISMKYLNRNKKKCSDFILNIAQEGIKQESFDSKSALKSIEYGRNAMINALPKIKKIIKEKTAKFLLTNEKSKSVK